MRAAPLLAAFAIAAGLVVVAPVGAQPAGADRAKLQGKWGVSKVEWPADVPAEHRTSKATTDALTLTVAGERITIDWGRKDVPSEYAVLKENPMGALKRIEFLRLKDKDGKEKIIPPTKAIYRFDGAALVVALPLDPALPWPTEFKPTMLPVPGAGKRQAPVVLVTFDRKK